MKCPKCGGTGEMQICEMGFIGKDECDKCHGKGYLTTEEWLRSATFEEMAGAIYEWYSQGHIEGKVGKQLSSVTRVVEWLKEKHDGNVL
jgi:ssDNA-binding Zn-finger/Zn-ribbon topoisomerase 1